MKSLKQLMVQLSLATAILALVASPAFSGSIPNGKPFVEIEGQIIEVQGRITTIEDTIDSILYSVGSVEELLAAVEDEIASLQNQNSSLEDLIAANSTDINSINSAIGILQDQIVTLQDQINSNDGDIADLQSQIADHASLIDALQMCVNEGLLGLQNQIALNADDIGDLHGLVAEIMDELAIKQHIINGTCQEGSAMRQINPDGSVVCESPAQTIGSLVTKTAWVEATIPGHPHGQVTALIADCGPGWLSVGGGYKMPSYCCTAEEGGWSGDMDGNLPLLVSQSYVGDPSVWQCRFANRVPQTRYVVCMARCIKFVAP